MTVERLFIGDPRCTVLLDAVVETIYERGIGLPLPSIIGVLDLAKQSILEDQK